MEIKFRLKTDSVNSAGESAVIIDVHYNVLRLKLSTGGRYLEKDGDKKKERFQPTF
jgi:hypothetical protein